MFKDEPNRVSSLFAVQPRFGASAWTGTVRVCGVSAGQNGARAAEQDEEAAPAEQHMTQPMLERRGRASLLQSTKRCRLNLFFTAV